MKTIKLKHIKSGRVNEFSEEFVKNLLNQNKGKVPEFEIVKEVKEPEIKEKVVKEPIETKKEKIEKEIKID